MDRVKDLDLYQLLEVEQDADEKTLKTAYRKKALTCHPDKNPDNKVNLSF
jgi:curved DNA-binding protein CbpA